MTKKVICFGEVLYDVFPTHRKIGGAPLNVAIRMASLGINTKIISRVGNDEIGKELIKEGLLIAKTTHYGLEVSLNPRMHEEIMEFIKNWRFNPQQQSCKQLAA